MRCTEPRISSFYYVNLQFLLRELIQLNQLRADIAGVSEVFDPFWGLLDSLVRKVLFEWVF